jgi:alcohol dehydrogenase class IV
MANLRRTQWHRTFTRNWLNTWTTCQPAILVLRAAWKCASCPERGVESLILATADLKEKLNIPATIREAGISRSDFETQVRHMAEVAFDDQCVGANPCYPLVDDLVRVFWEAFDATPEGH